MKYLLIVFILCFEVGFVAAQNVTVGTIPKLNVCTADTIWVPYSSTGIFNADNFFAAQLSDGNGTFKTFTNIGNSKDAQGIIPVVMWSSGVSYKVRIIATSPYTISENTSSVIKVFDYPSPKPAPQIRNTHLGPTAFVGDIIKFTDVSESPGSQFAWSFEEDANIITSTSPAPTVIYPTIGLKSGSLSVTNPAGCATTKTFALKILSC
ncbi:MAG: hypothetical protein ABI778_12280, partial [Ignavibacteriota bacterium]